MSYYHARKVQLAKQYLESRDAEQRPNREDARMTRSKVWLDRYMARPRRSNINWEPRYPMTPPEEQHHGTQGEEIIEGEFTELADFDPSGGIGSEEATASGAGIAGSGVEDAPGRAQEGERAEAEA